MFNTTSKETMQKRAGYERVRTVSFERSGTIERRTLRVYWVVAAIIMAISLSGTVTIIYRDYTGRVDEAGRRVMYLAQALAEHTTQIFVKLDALSQAIIEDATDRIVSEEALSEVMRRRAAAEPAALGIAIVDRTGLVRASGINSYPVGKDMSKHLDFILFSSKQAPEFHVSRPYQSDFSVPGDYSSWTMSYSRRMEDGSGSFTGYVLIVVDESYLYGFYGRLNPEPGMVLGLVGQDGVIRASNVREVIGRNVEPNIRNQIRAGEGIKISPSVRTGIRRIFAYYKSSAAPLLAYVGVPVAPLYRAWFIASSVPLAALAALFAALIALGLVLGGYIRNRASLMRSTIEATKQRHEKEFLETIVNTGEVLMAVTDDRGTPVVVNHALRSLFPTIEFTGIGGTTMSALLGENIEQIASDLPWQNVHELTLTNCKRCALSWSVSAIRDATGAIKNLVIVGLDITERREAELAIYQSAKLVTLGEMATGIAHEINQPLATLAMAVDNMQARIESGKADVLTVSDDLELISNQIDRAANIVHHMRIYGHKNGSGMRPIDLKDAIQGALSIAKAQIISQGIQIECDFASINSIVFADLLLVEQIIINLLLNARDAIVEDARLSPEAEGRIRIRIQDDAQDMIAVAVIDTGPGVPYDIKDKLFEPFFSTKPIGKGTGLGLSLGYGMARDMGGRLEVVDVVSGAEFRLILRSATSIPDTGNCDDYTIDNSAN